MRYGIAITLRLAALAGVALLMLVPTGMCVCCESEEATEQHEPGCPEVRKLDRAAASQVYQEDLTPAPMAIAADAFRPSAPLRTVAAVAHGPPRDQPIYLTFQTLLI